MSVDLSKVSVVQWFSDTEKHRCGYCKNENSSISNGMWAETLTVEDYQDLIDRGWRRSGKYCYKPIMNETCCPQYTIRCDTGNFVLSKSQKKIIKKFNKFLEDGVLNNKDVPPVDHYDVPDGPIFSKKDSNISIGKIQLDYSEISGDDNLGRGEPHHSRTVDAIKEKVYGDISKTISSQKTNLKSTCKEGVGVDTSKPPCKKAKLLRLERKKEKLSKKGVTFEKREQVQGQKTIEQHLEEINKESSKHKLRITLERMCLDKDKYFEASAKLFQKYQMLVHNEPLDECNAEQFYNFLVRTPLKPSKFPNGIDGPGYGSFHQQYWIDDKLIAVGVIDILPRCVSSVYFFYDPDYRNLTLGTYGSLREVQFTRSLHEKIPSIRNYYMGFYIHSCPKMRYKGNLVPSFLLCPETYYWVPIEKCVDKLDVHKYARLNNNDVLDENIPKRKDIAEIKVVYGLRLMRFKDYKKLCNKEDLFNHIGTLVGVKCTKRMVFCEP